jgi:hypothetical protein
VAKSKEESDLAKAIALSLQDSGSSNYLSRSFPESVYDIGSGSLPTGTNRNWIDSNLSKKAINNWENRRQHGFDNETSTSDADDNDPELAAAIKESLKEMQKPRPSAPFIMPSDTASEYSNPYVSGAVKQSSTSQVQINSTEPSPRERDALLTFSNTVHAAHYQNTDVRASLNRAETRMSRGDGGYENEGSLFERAQLARSKLIVGTEEATGRLGEF